GCRPRGVPLPRDRGGTGGVRGAIAGTARRRRRAGSVAGNRQLAREPHAHLHDGRGPRDRGRRLTPYPRRVMLPVLIPEEMAAVDAAATAPVAVLSGGAGAAVAREALAILGGTYGRRVVVVAGKGNNGNDGRDAARRLQRRGIRVHPIAAHHAPPV